MELSFDIAKVHHDGKHHMKLSIEKDSNIRHTFCTRCMKCVKWERVVSLPELPKGVN